MIGLLLIVSSTVHAQFMEYESLPIIPPKHYIIPSGPSIEDKVIAERRRRLEMEVLKEQRDLLRGLNGNSSPSNSSNFISLKLLGASTSDLQFNFKTDWVEFTKNCSLTIDKANSRVILSIPDLDKYSTYKIVDLQIHNGDGYSVSTLELESGNFISVLNVNTDKVLWVLWGTKGEQELVVFQSIK